MLMLVAIVFIFDGGQGFLSGPIVAMGLQQTASYFAIASYYIIGIPLAYTFSKWQDFGAYGLFAGIGIAVFF